MQHRRAGTARPDNDKTQASPPNWRIPAAEIETTVIAQLGKRLADPHWLLKNAAGRQTIAQRKAMIAQPSTRAGIEKLNNFREEYVIDDALRRLSLDQKNQSRPGGY